MTKLLISKSIDDLVIADFINMLRHHGSECIDDFDKADLRSIAMVHIYCRTEGYNCLAPYTYTVPWLEAIS